MAGRRLGRGYLGQCETAGAFNHLGLAFQMGGDWWRARYVQDSIQEVNDVLHVSQGD